MLMTASLWPSPFGAGICSDVIGVSPSGILGFGVSPCQTLVESRAGPQEAAPRRRARVGLGWTPPGPLGPAPPPDLLITRVKNILDLKTRGELVIFSVFRFVAALVCREQILLLNSSRNQEQPRPGTAGGALVSKLPSWRRSALSRIFRAASAGIADAGFWGRSGNPVLDQSTTGF